jgi:L-lactate dehydrogenase complex protein LldG
MTAIRVEHGSLGSVKVALFVPCYIDAYFPEVGIAPLEILERLGCSVENQLDQTCCGQPMANSDAARAKVAELFPAAKVVCLAAPEIPGTRRVQDVRGPRELNDVDVGVVRSPLGAAEAGAIWLTERELVVNALGVLPQHLIVQLDPAAVVETMHDAYAWIDLAASPYGVFIAGPSATGDIEGVIIHGAQGARSLTVLLLAPALSG